MGRRGRNRRDGARRASRIKTGTTADGVSERRTEESTRAAAAFPPSLRLPLAVQDIGLAVAVVVPGCVGRERGRGSHGPRRAIRHRFPHRRVGLRAVLSAPADALHPEKAPASSYRSSGRIPSCRWMRTNLSQGRRAVQSRLASAGRHRTRGARGTGGRAVGRVVASRQSHRVAGADVRSVPVSDPQPDL